jgi:hypothetical protein
MYSDVQRVKWFLDRRWEGKLRQNNCKLPNKLYREIWLSSLELSEKDSFVIVYFHDFIFSHLLLLQAQKIHLEH